jgi:hypothetical protein
MRQSEDARSTLKRIMFVFMRPVRIALPGYGTCSHALSHDRFSGLDSTSGK